MRVKALQLASLVLVTMATSTIAQADHQQNNFYVGVSAGNESRHSDYTFDYVLAFANPATAALLVPNTAGLNQHQSTRVVDVGSQLGFLAGWQIQCNRTLLGLEVSADMHSFEEAKQVLFADNVGVLGAVLQPQYLASVKYDRGTQYQLAARAGWWLTPFFMPYVKLGLQYSRDTIEFTAPLRQLNSHKSFNKKDDVWGGVAGLGVEFPAFGPTSIRAEFNYVQTASMSLADEAIGSALEPVGTHKIHDPKSYIGKVAWVWNFE